MLTSECALGWSEKNKSWKMLDIRSNSEQRHSTDFRAIFEIMIPMMICLLRIWANMLYRNRRQFWNPVTPQFQVIVLKFRIGPIFF